MLPTILRGSMLVFVFLKVKFRDWVSEHHKPRTNKFLLSKPELEASSLYSLMSCVFQFLSQLRFTHAKKMLLNESAEFLHWQQKTPGVFSEVTGVTLLPSKPEIISIGPDILSVPDNVLYTTFKPDFFSLSSSILVPCRHFLCLKWKLLRRLCQSRLIQDFHLTTTWYALPHTRLFSFLCSSLFCRCDLPCLFPTSSPSQHAPVRFYWTRQYQEMSALWLRLYEDIEFEGRTLNTPQ